MLDKLRVEKQHREEVRLKKEKRNERKVTHG